MRWFSMLRTGEKKGASRPLVRASATSEARIISDSPSPEVTDLIAAFLPNQAAPAEAGLQWA